MANVFLIWAYSEENVYGTVNRNRDVVCVFMDENKALAKMRTLEETVGKKFNVAYRITSKELHE